MTARLRSLATVGSWQIPRIILTKDRSLEITWLCRISAQHGETLEVRPTCLPDTVRNCIRIFFLPPGASEKYASYDDHVRAELMAQRPAGPDSYDARRPCKDVSLITDPEVAVDISTFAYRADEVERGNCWAVRAAELHSSDGEMLIGLGWFMGWYEKTDTVRGCKTMETIGTRNVWAMIVLRDCYHSSNDPGFPKDTAKEQKIGDWLDANGGHQLSQIDYDDIEVQRQLERKKLIDHPPMKTGYSGHYCHHVAGDLTSCQKTGFYMVEDKDKVIDVTELQRELREIDEKFNSIQ